MSAILFCICSIVFDTFCFCLYATLKWKVLDIYFSLCNVYKVCSTKGLSLLLCFLYLRSYWRFLSLFFNFILWIWLAGFDMSGLLLANHWSFFKVSSVPRLSCHICHLQPSHRRGFVWNRYWDFLKELPILLRACLLVAVFVSLFRAINWNIRAEPAVDVPTENW